MTGTEIGAVIYALLLFIFLVGVIILASIYEGKINEQRKDFIKKLSNDEKALICEYQQASKVNLFSKKKYEEK